MVRYTPQIFRISNELKKRSGLPSRQKYALETLDGLRSFYKPSLEKDKNAAKRKVKFQKYTFWGKELQKVNEQESSKKHMTLVEAIKLNKLAIITTGDLRDIVLKSIPFKNRNPFYEEELVEEEEPEKIQPTPTKVVPSRIAPPPTELPVRKGTRIRLQTVKAAELQAALSTTLK